jgi:translocation and assembly module TamB
LRRWGRRLAGGVVALLLAVGAALLLVDTGVGHRFVADRIAEIRTPTGLSFRVGRIDGSLYGRARLTDVRVYDARGLFLQAPAAELDWRPLAWLGHRLDIRALVIPRARVLKPLQTIRTGRQGPVLPGFDIAICRLEVTRLELAAPVTGRPRVGRLAGRAEIRSGRALVVVDAEVAGSDRLRVRIDAEPDRDRFDMDATGTGAADGVLARLTGLRRPLALSVSGDGSWRRWRGQARLEAAGARTLALALAADAGAYRLSGTVDVQALTRGKLQRLTAPRVAVDGRATLENRRLAGTLALRSAALDVAADGTVDLARGAFRHVRLRAALLRPPALFPNMTGRAIRLRAIVDGPFATAGFDYRLDAERFAFDATGFEDAHAAGRGRWSRAPVLLPVAFRAARVTGVGDVAGGILRNLSLSGVLRVTPELLTGDDLRLRSDKLTGRIGLTLDLRTGRYDVGLNGALGRYLIPGLGVVDVTSRLQVVPGPGGRGTRVVGRGVAVVRRLDNAFFRSLAGGLPRIETGLERGPDGVLHFRNLVLAAPALRLAGNGLRRRDGTFRFEGGGTQRTYGPLTLRLDGRIDKPTLDLVFRSPNAALGLSAVRAHLDPTPAGFAFTAAGGSRLGAFTGEGAILLPRGGQAAIEAARIDVAGTRAAGRLAIVDGGFAGRLGVGGGGLAGDLPFRVDGTVQVIEAHLRGENARLGELGSLRRGRLDATVRLEPAGTVISATASGIGFRRGGLRLARFAANLRMTGGEGELRAAIAGSRGRAYDLQTVTRIAADRYEVRAGGTLDRRPLQLLTPAVVTRAGDGWQLAPTRFAFAGGEAEVGGTFGGGTTAIDARLVRMPLAILDIGYPGLGLAGTAFGRLSYRDAAGAAPTGRMDVTIRGLSRSGLVLSSTPIDLGLAGVLTGDRVGLRAVIASAGRTVGRAQALLTPLGGSGGLAERLAAAPLVGQLRYAGPADTLWRLTGVELFDLTGPVTVTADATGRLADPAIRGTVALNGARLESATTGTVLTGIQASGRFGGSQLLIDRFAGDAGEGGRVTGTGRFDVAAVRGFGIDLRLQAEHARLIRRDDIAATVTGPITIRSDGTGGVIGGSVTLDRSRYRLGQATVASAVPRLAVREVNVPFGGGEDDAAPTPWRLDLTARAPERLTVTGLGLSSEWSADFRIRGEPANPAITGHADLIRGNVEFAGREFELQRGLIRFDGQVPANPSLDIAANADAPGLSATIRVTGFAQKPEIAFTSVPALPQDELLSRLLFGTSITNLSAPEALQLAAAVAALQNGGNGLNPINAVRRAAGLDRLRILPADVQQGRGTSVAAGKYVTRRLYAEIVTDGQGYSATQVEFQVTRWLSVLSSISTLGRTSANVRVSKDY